MKRFSFLLLSGTLILSLTACGNMIRQSSSIPEAFSSFETKNIEEYSSDTTDTTFKKAQTLYQQMVRQVENGNYYSATQTFLSDGQSLTSYKDASSYYTYARALFYCHNKYSYCLGQPLYLLKQIPDFLSSDSYIKEIKTKVSPYEGTYTYTDSNDVSYRISIQDGLVSYEVLTPSSKNLANYKNQLVLVTESDGNQRMYSSNFNYTSKSDLNYSLVFQKDGSLSITSADENHFDTFSGLYTKTSDKALKSR